MELTIDLPDYLANSVRANRQDIDRIIEAGLRDLQADSSAGYHDLADVLKFLATLPSPAETLELRPSKELSGRISELLEKNRNSSLTEDDGRFWESYEFIEHIVRLAKKAALAKLEK